MNHRTKNMRISAEFKSELERELFHLRHEVRPSISARLNVAREGGDLTDNSAYEQAKEDLARLMVRMAEIEETLREAQVLDHNCFHAEVEVGSIVTLARDDGRTCRYTIVNSLEASPGDGKISDESPIGRAIVGHKCGETVLVQVPARTVSYTITEIQ